MEIPANNLTEDAKTLCDIPQNIEINAKDIENDHNLIATNFEVIFVEPFYGGSHKQLIEFLRRHVPNSHLVTLSAKKWHWRARCSSLILSSMIPKVTKERILFCSSVLNLAELLGLRPDLVPLKKVVYFHENQLVYPIREIKSRDIQYGYNQITTCLAADLVIFNSNYNKNSFLDHLKNIIKILPDYRPKGIKEVIEKKCKVLYFPLEHEQCLQDEPRSTSSSTLHIVWPHRWEFDKDPETFLQILLRLKYEGIDFRVSLLGETFTEVPEIFNRAKDTLRNEIAHIGFVKKKEDYFRILRNCHVVVSTAKHEFFGVSMLEASICGCVPLVPNRLVYPEIYPEDFLYKDEEDLYLHLKKFCADPTLTDNLCKKYEKYFRTFFNNNLLLAEYLEIFN